MHPSEGIFAALPLLSVYIQAHSAVADRPLLLLLLFYLSCSSGMTGQVCTRWCDSMVCKRLTPCKGSQQMQAA
jgi:hypothetical protein